MSCNVRSGGVFKPANQIWIKQSGVWKQVLQGWVRQAGVWKQFFSSFIGVGVVANTGTSFGYRDGAGGVGSQVVFNSDGSILRNMIAGTDDTSSGSTAWLAAVASGNGTPYWLRATLTGGTLWAGTTGVWLQCSVNRTFQVYRSALGLSVANISVDFATDAAGVNIVSSGNLWYLRAQAAPL